MRIMTTKEDKFAVITTGGKQYLVREGDVIKVEKIADDLEPGASVVFDNVLLRAEAGNVELGEPNVASAKVEAELVENGRSKKISVIRFRAKSNRSYTNKGHRQHYSKVLIKKV